MVTSSFSQVPQTIDLNPPDKTRGVQVMQAFANRSSVKEWNPEPLKLQDLSDLLWAANGVNRPDDGKRTAPSAMNSQDIDIYVFLETGAYLYNAVKHRLELQAEGDHRKLVAGMQKDAAEAPVMCLLVSDISRFKFGKKDKKLTWAANDAGIVSQNICLFCAGMGLITRTRASMDEDKLWELLNLSDSQYPLLNNPVSYPIE